MKYKKTTLGLLVTGALGLAIGNSCSKPEQVFNVQAVKHPLIALPNLEAYESLLIKKATRSDDPALAEVDEARQFEEFFPLNVGNKWVYEREIQGSSLYQLEQYGETVLGNNALTVKKIATEKLPKTAAITYEVKRKVDEGFFEVEVSTEEKGKVNTEKILWRNTGSVVYQVNSPPNKPTIASPLANLEPGTIIRSQRQSKEITPAYSLGAKVTENPNFAHCIRNTVIFNGNNLESMLFSEVYDIKPVFLEDERANCAVTEATYAKGIGLVHLEQRDSRGNITYTLTLKGYTQNK